MLDNISGFHLEPTNICTLKCPRCSRTKFIEQFPNKWSNKQLNLDDLKKFLDIDLTKKLFRLNGNNGDPIYYDQLFELVEWIKTQGADVQITTNGSYRTIEWWETLGSLLTETDTVMFSIDGTPDNFTNYRVNADWKSMATGINIITKSPAKTIWKYISFSYNVTDVETVQKLSQELGFDEFYLVHSDRWDSESDWLKPDGLKGPREDAIIKWHRKEKLDLNPKCKNNKEHYISSDGFYIPCCFIGDFRFYYRSEFYKNQDNYDISKTTITQILHRTKFIPNSDLEYCAFNCPQI
jgi:MoaA/NifB/PqqE/SkfB family radical SAM enzyme